MKTYPRWKPTPLRTRIAIFIFGVFVSLYAWLRPRFGYSDFAPHLLRWRQLAGAGLVLALACAAGARLVVASLESQQPKPTEYTLSPEASKAIIQLEAQRREIDRSENLIFLGARVPPDSRQCAWDESLIVICSKPAARAAPTPKTR